MARKNLNRGLGALAALGALSYHISRDKGAPNRAPVDDRNTGATAPAGPATAASADPAAADQGDTSDFLSRRLRVNPETGQAYSMDNLSPMGGAGPAAPAGAGAGTRSLAAASAPAPAPAAGAVDPDAANMFRAQERAERATPAMHNPNISELVYLVAPSTHPTWVILLRRSMFAMP